MCTACRRAFGFSKERDREIRGIGMEGKVRCNRVCLASIVVCGVIPSLFDPGRYLRVGGIKSRHQPQDLCAQSPRFMPEGGDPSLSLHPSSPSRGMNGNEFWPREGKGSLLGCLVLHAVRSFIGGGNFLCPRFFLRQESRYFITSGARPMFCLAGWRDKQPPNTSRLSVYSYVVLCGLCTSPEHSPKIEGSGPYCTDIKTVYGFERPAGPRSPEVFGAGMPYNADTNGCGRSHFPPHPRKREQGAGADLLRTIKNHFRQEDEGRAVASRIACSGKRVLDRKALDRTILKLDRTFSVQQH